MAPKAAKAAAEKENVSLGPDTREGEQVFGVCHIYASFNDSAPPPLARSLEPAPLAAECTARDPQADCDCACVYHKSHHWQRFAAIPLAARVL